MHHAHEVSFSITLLFAALLAAMVLLLAFEEKIHAKKSVITGTFAILCVFLADVCGILPIGDLVNVFNEHLHIPVYITGIEWEVIAVIVGCSLFVDVTSRSGLFTWIAMKLTKTSKGDPVVLLAYYSFLTVVFSAFLNNVTAMIIIGSLTAVSLQKLEKTKYLLAFLLIEGLLTNIGGLLTLISSVPNIIVGTTAGISFMKFFLVSAPFVVVASVGTVYLGKLFFGIKRLTTDEEKKQALELVSTFDERDGIKSKLFFTLSSIAFVALIFFFATASNLPYLKDLGLGFIALAFGILCLWVYKHEVNRFYSGLDWDLIWFFLTLFVVINTMEHARVLGMIGSGIKELIALGPNLGPTSLLWCSALASSVTDNIPLAAVLAKILAASNPVPTPESPLWWSVIFGANLGGNITPIGSASTVVAVTIIHKHKLPLSFVGFVKLAIPYALAQLVLASLYVWLFI